MSFKLETKQMCAH